MSNLQNKKHMRWLAGLAALFLGGYVLSVAWHNSEGISRVRAQGEVFAYDRQTWSYSYGCGESKSFTGGDIRNHNPARWISKQCLFGTSMLVLGVLLFLGTFQLRTLLLGVLLIATAGALPFLQPPPASAPSAPGSLPARVNVFFEQDLSDERIRALEIAVQSSGVLAVAPVELRREWEGLTYSPIINVSLAPSPKANPEDKPGVICRFDFDARLAEPLRRNLLDFFSQEVIYQTFALAKAQGIPLHASTVVTKSPALAVFPAGPPSPPIPPPNTVKTPISTAE